MEIIPLQYESSATDGKSEVWPAHPAGWHERKKQPAILPGFRGAGDQLRGFSFLSIGIGRAAVCQNREDERRKEMPRAYSEDLRHRVVADTATGLSIRAVAAKYSVSPSFVSKLTCR